MSTPGTPWWHRAFEDGAREDPADERARPPAFIGMLGIAPESWEPEGVVRFAWEPPAFTRTPGGWVQGGFQSVVLDMAQTFAVFTQIPEGSIAMTLEMKVSYIGAAMPPRFTVVGRAVRVGRTAAHTEGTIHSAEGDLIATSTSTLIVKRFAP